MKCETECCRGEGTERVFDNRGEPYYLCKGCKNILQKMIEACARIGVYW